MKSTADRRAADRSRAVRRLRNLTLGTAVAGLAATGAFGALAAATYQGTWSDAGARVITVAAADSATTEDSTSIASAPPATTPAGTAHVSTGGS